MQPLPEENYAHIVLPVTWLTYFQSLDLPKKVSLISYVFQIIPLEETTLQFKLGNDV